MGKRRKTVTMKRLDVDLVVDGRKWSTWSIHGLRVAEGGAVTVKLPVSLRPSTPHESHQVMEYDS